jgi:hypothetical protein
MPRPGYRARRSLVCGLSLLLSAAACSQPTESSTSTRAPAEAPVGPEAVGQVLGHVGNQASGIDAQPDFDAFALRLQETVGPRLPATLPAPKAACRAMLDAALDFYEATEGEGSTAVAAIERARGADERRCVVETSPAAATCVAILLSDQAGEYAWLVDQCSRAFPSS